MLSSQETIFTVNVSSHEEVKKIVDFFHTNMIPFTVQSNSFFVKEKLSDLYKPTEHFKEFCGSHCLNSDGLTSCEDVLYIINNNIRNQRIKKEGGVIYANDWIKELFQSSKERYYESELPGLILSQLFIV